MPHPADPEVGRYGVWRTLVVMNAAWRSRLLVLGLIVVAAVWFTRGITWGLPSRAVDPYLFGDREPWSGEKILELTGGRPYDTALGADVDRDPLTKGDRPIVLNETDDQRAAIIMRYRLYTYQPDEMITIMALASMRPGEGDFDPKLYQYGGLWIYPVGALLKLASVCGAITLTPDPAYYLDHPEAFGRFYVVARLYVVAWALLGVWAVFWIAHRLSGSRPAAAVAALCYIVMPVVVNMAHEAKPHLPAAVLMLLAIMAAVKLVETGRLRWVCMTGALCGAALSMVLSALAIFSVPVLGCLLMPVESRSGVRPIPALKKLTHRMMQAMDAVTLGVLTYLVTTWYLPANLLSNRAVLESNFGNSLAMYEIARLGEGCLNAVRLIREGTSTLLALAGAGGALLLFYRTLSAYFRKNATHAVNKSGMNKTGWILAAPAILIMIQFAALAAGKPGEYGRFAVFPDIVLGVAAIVALHKLVVQHRLKIATAVVLIGTTAIPGIRYLRGFIRDSGPAASRMTTAGMIDELHDSGLDTLGVIAEPAPYVMPPIDLFQWKLLLIDPLTKVEQRDALADVVLNADVSRGMLGAPVDLYTDWPRSLSIKREDVYNIISWADRRFDLWVLKEKAPS